MIYNLLNIINISSNQDRVAGKHVGLLSLMELWWSQTYWTVISLHEFLGLVIIHYLWGRLEEFKFGCVTKFTLSPLGLCNILIYTPPPPNRTHNHFIGSQSSIFPSFYSVSNDWSLFHSPWKPCFPLKFSTLPTPWRMTGPFITYTPLIRIWQVVSNMVEPCINAKVKYWQVKLTWKIMLKWRTSLSLSFIWSWREMCSFTLAVSLPNPI